MSNEISNNRKEEDRLSVFDVSEFFSRIQELYHYVADTYQEFQDQTGIPKTSLTSYLRKKNPSKPGSEFFLIVKDRFPEIDLNYMFTGSGNLLASIENKGELEEPGSVYQEGEMARILRNQNRLLDAHRELIELLRTKYESEK